MAIKVEIDQENDIMPNVDGHFFQIPTITRTGDKYKLNNLSLPIDWEDRIADKSKRIDVENFCKRFEQLSQIPDLSGKVLVGEDSGLITRVELDLPSLNKTRVNLGMMYGSQGASYHTENISSIHNVIPYQNFLARYLNIFNNNNRFSFIDTVDDAVGRYFFQNLRIPKEILDIKDPEITDANFQNNFMEKIIYITGQFSSLFNNIKYNDRGLISLFNVDGNDVHTNLCGDEYFKHNIDNAFQAATLYNTVATFLNDIIESRRINIQ